MTCQADHSPPFRFARVTKEVSAETVDRRRQRFLPNGKAAS
jgi:hypothetical protein